MIIKGTAILGIEGMLKSSSSTSVYASPLQFLRQSWEFHETWYKYEHYVTGAHPNVVIFNLLKSIIIIIRWPREYLNIISILWLQLRICEARYMKCVKHIDNEYTLTSHMRLWFNSHKHNDDAELCTTSDEFNGHRVRTWW